MSKAEFVFSGISAALAIAALILLSCLMFGSCNARAGDFDQGKDLNGIWEEAVLPSLASCEEFVSWSRDQREIYMKDYFHDKYLGADRMVSRCLSRYADDASLYVVGKCKRDSRDIKGIITHADDIIKTICIEWSLDRNSLWRTNKQ